MFGLGMQELVIIFVIVVPIFLIFYFGFVSGKNKGMKQGLDYSAKKKAASEQMNADILPSKGGNASEIAKAQAITRTQAERLRELSNLLQEGLISDEEFNHKKKEILDGI